MFSKSARLPPLLLFCVACALVALIYWPGLSGDWLFDDFPNIVENPAVQPHNTTLASLLNAMYSSPASEFKRPLASLSFAMNYLAGGLNPYWMKLTNLVIHLLNGLLVFFLSRSLMELAEPNSDMRRRGFIAVMIATGWMLLPINLTAVLYVVQRMESMANFFVLLGLIGYVAGRRRMLAADSTREDHIGLFLCIASLIVPTSIGALAKETAVMLPLYALLIEGTLIGFRKVAALRNDDVPLAPTYELRLVGLFLVVLALPMIIGLIWVLPSFLKPQVWATRDFTLGTRLLSETRVVVDYIRWTLLPSPQALSFYHDNFRISTGLFSPWTTLASILILLSLTAAAVLIRSRYPLVALGIALFLGCHLLTATVLPLELIYEHRNYFASFGLMLAVITQLLPTTPSKSWRLGRNLILSALILLWTGQTALTAYAWGNPLTLAVALAARAPDSPRAQYELGRAYIIAANNDPNSPYLQRLYAPLETAAALPGSPILPEQALIFANARLHKPIEQAWWDSMVRKLQDRNPGIQDESSLMTLTHCIREHECDLPRDQMMRAFDAALSHPNPTSRLLSIYSDYAWNVLGDHDLGVREAKAAMLAEPSQPAYHITQVRMLLALKRYPEALSAMAPLQAMNVGGRLDADIHDLQMLFPPGYLPPGK